MKHSVHSRWQLMGVSEGPPGPRISWSYRPRRLRRRGRRLWFPGSSRTCEGAPGPQCPVSLSPNPRPSRYGGWVPGPEGRPTLGSWPVSLWSREGLRRRDCAGAPSCHVLCAWPHRCGALGRPLPARLAVPQRLLSAGSGRPPRRGQLLPGPVCHSLHAGFGKATFPGPHPDAREHLACSRKTPARPGPGGTTGRPRGAAPGPQRRRQE